MKLPDIPLIVLLTDFGKDPYVGIMKGKILQINPNTNIISLTNHINKHDIKHGAFILEKSYKNFPEKTIFLVVVDPGVGSLRQAIAAKKDNYYFIGPDNGILYPILKEVEAVDIVNIPIPGNASSTFHGRDVFAPTAARLSLNFKLDDLGSPTTLETSLDFFWDSKTSTGEVIFIDTFGNIITNIPSKEESNFSEKYQVETNNFTKIMKIHKTYNDGSSTNPFLISSSFDTFELAIRNGKASEKIDLKPGEHIKIVSEFD